MSMLHQLCVNTASILCQNCIIIVSILYQLATSIGTVCMLTLATCLEKSNKYICTNSIDIADVQKNKWTAKERVHIHFFFHNQVLTKCFH